MLYLVMKDGKAAIVEAAGSDAAYIAAAPLFGIEAGLPENIDLDLCREIGLNEVIDVSDAC